MSIVRRNIAANYVTMAFVIAAPIIALPMYIESLGIKLWGYVSLMTMIQGFLAMLDAGISQALVRSFSRLRCDENHEKAIGNLLYTFEFVNIVLSVILILFLWFLAYIYSNIKGAVNLSLADSGLAIAMVGSCIFFFVINAGSVYRSLLIAKDKQPILGSITTTFVIARHITAVVMVSIYPSLIVYVLAHASIYLFETFVRGIVAWKYVENGRKAAHWDGEALKITYPFIVAMAASSVVGVMSAQLDKLFVSLLLPIEDLGIYAIASVFGFGAVQLIYPLCQATLPKYTMNIGSRDVIAKLNRRMLMLVALASLLGWVIYGFLGEIFLLHYLPSHTIAHSVYPILTVLLVGATFNALWCVWTVNLIAGGQAGNIFKINILALVLSSVLYPILIIKNGITGASYAFVAMNIVGLISSYYLVRRGVTKQNEHI